MRGLFRNVMTTLAAVAVMATLGAFAEEGVYSLTREGEGRKSEPEPQELQASAEPSRERVIPEGYYPVTQVRLPERVQRGVEGIDSGVWFYNFAAGGNDIFGGAPSESVARTGDSWFTNFAAGGNAIFGDAMMEEGVRFEGRGRAWYDNFASGGNDIFGDSAEERQTEREAAVDEEGYLIFSEGVSSGAGYASLILPDSYYDEGELENDRGVRIPKAFSFESEDSPIIVAEASSPGSDGRVMASVRRGKSFIAVWPGREGTGIIEREPLEPRPNHGTPAMVPPASGKLRRAEVKLPTSSQGLGMASGYYPGR